MKDLLRTIYREMDPATGMFPASWKCFGCGKSLDADSNHPAERYAGTYTGLCYPCTGRPPYVQGVYALDGALSVSHPPHSPSWRRARESFTAYDGCLTCNGEGALWQYRFSDRWRSQCRPCWDRFFGHPLRRWASQRDSRIRRAAQNIYEASLRRAKLVRLAKQGKVPQEYLDAIRAPVLRRYEHTRARWEALRGTRFTDEPVSTASL